MPALIANVLQLVVRLPLKPQIINLKNKLNMETKISNEVENGKLQQGAVSSRFSDGYSEEWKLKTQAARLRSIINSGLGITNKPISSKRMAKLKRNLAEIEAALNGC